MFHLRHHQERHSLQRIVHLCLLLGWMLSSHGFAPAVCLVAAHFDGAHRVNAGATFNGEPTVVLSHESAENELRAHDLLCDFLLVFAAQPLAVGADHVLTFRSMDVVSRAQPGVLVKLQAPPLCLPSAIFMPSWQEGQRAHVSTRKVHAPAWSPGLALKAGRTIMLC